MNAASVCGKFETSRRREPVALIVQGALPSFSCPGCDLVLGLPLFEMLGASRRFQVNRCRLNFGLERDEFKQNRRRVLHHHLAMTIVDL